MDVNKPDSQVRKGGKDCVGDNENKKNDLCFVSVDTYIKQEYEEENSPTVEGEKEEDVYSEFDDESAIVTDYCKLIMENGEFPDDSKHFGSCEEYGSDEENIENGAENLDHMSNKNYIGRIAGTDVLGMNETSCDSFSASEHQDRISKAQCDVCNKYFATYRTLAKHKLIHTDVKHWKCNECDKSFATKYYLNQHTLQHSENKKFKCNMCTKSFTRPSVLRKHVTTHGVKRYLCDICNKALRTSDNLAQHKLSHSGDRTFQCEYCSKCFFSASNLKRHKLIHNGDKKFVCDVCNEAFTTVSFLTSHKLVHRDVKYFCDMCDKVYSRMWDLTEHKLTHRNIKLRCHICNKGFAYVRNLRKHNRFIHSRTK